MNTPTPPQAALLPPPRYAAGALVWICVTGTWQRARIVSSRRTAGGWPVATYRLELLDVADAPWTLAHDRDLQEEEPIMQTEALYSLANTAPEPLYKVGDQVAVANPDRPEWHGQVVRILLIDHHPAGIRYQVSCIAAPAEVTTIAETAIVGVQATLATLDAAPGAEDPAIYPVGYSGPMPLALIWDDPDNERGVTLPEIPQLADSIRAEGQIEPLIVFAHSGLGGYQISAGHRRRAALALLERPTAWVAVVDPPPEAADRTVRRLVSNVLRLDLGPLQLAHGLQALVQAGLSQKEIARRVSLSQPQISKYVSLLKEPPPLQAMLAAGTLKPGHVEQLHRMQEAQIDYDGREVATVEEARLRYATNTVNGDFSVNELKHQVDSFLSDQRFRRQMARDREARTTKVAQADATNPLAAEERQAEDARYQAEAAARAAAWDAERARLRRLGDVARQAIADLLGWVAGVPPPLEVWRICGWYLLAHTGLARDDARLAAWDQALSGATTMEEIAPLLGALTLAQFTFHYRATALHGYGTEPLLEARYGFNAAISSAQVAAGLVEAPPAAPAEALADGGVPFPERCPQCQGELVTDDDDDAILCPNCEVVYGYDTDTGPRGVLVPNQPCAQCDTCLAEDASDKGKLVCPHCGTHFDRDAVLAVAAGEVPMICPHCMIPLAEDDEGEITCPNCATVYGPIEPGSEERAV